MNGCVSVADLHHFNGVICLKAASQQNNNAAGAGRRGDSSDEESDGGLMFERTVTSERAPSETDMREIERKVDLWSRQLNSNIMVCSVESWSF